MVGNFEDIKIQKLKWNSNFKGTTFASAYPDPGKPPNKGLGALIGGAVGGLVGCVAGPVGAVGGAATGSAIGMWLAGDEK